MADYFKPRDTNAICDICGFKRKLSQLQKTWDGYMACRPTVAPGCWYSRQEQDFPPPVYPNEGRVLPDARPEQNDTYVSVPVLWSDEDNWEDIDSNWEST